MHALFFEHKAGGVRRMSAGGGGMNVIGTDLAANRLMYDEGIQVQEQWSQNVEVYT